MGILKIFPDFHIIDRMLLKGWSEDFLKKNLILPAFKEKGEVTVIMADPFNHELIQDVGRMFQCKIRPAIATSIDIKRALQQHFQKVSLDVMPRMALKSVDDKDLVVGDKGLSIGNQDGVVGVLDFVISNAIAEGASDVHIEPKESSLQVRYRIDGMLHHKTDLPISMSAALSSRIKILCKLGISEKRKHQDGRLHAQVMEQDVDMRVSVYAAAFGENIVIRILYRQSNFIDIDQLGITPENKRKFLELMALPSGVILVTGDKLVEFFNIYQKNAANGDGGQADLSTGELERFVDFVKAAMKHARSLAVSPFADLVLRKKNGDLEIVVALLVREQPLKAKVKGGRRPGTPTAQFY